MLKLTQPGSGGSRVGIQAFNHSERLALGSSAVNNQPPLKQGRALGSEGSCCGTGKAFLKRAPVSRDPSEAGYEAQDLRITSGKNLWFAWLRCSKESRVVGGGEGGYWEE